MCICIMVLGHFFIDAVVDLITALIKLICGLVRLKYPHSMVEVCTEYS